MNIKINKNLFLAFLLIIPFFQSFARDEVKVVGSSTVYPFSTIVAEKFGRKTKFKTPVIESTGTGGGMKLFCSGVGVNYPDISNASRAIKDSERDLCKKNGIQNIVEFKIGNDGISFANSVKSKKLSFTKKQLWLAMSEKGPKPKTWNEVDPSLPKVKIEILSPPPTSGTRDAWNSLVMEEGCDSKIKEANKKDCHIFREDGPVVEAGENDALIVQKLNANPDAFGIFGFSYLDQNLDKIQGMTIDGVEISLDNIQSYKYPISRPLYFYVKSEHIGIVPGIKEFLKEFTSSSAISEDGYLTDAGLVPLTDKQQGEIRSLAKNLGAKK